MLKNICKKFSLPRLKYFRKIALLTVVFTSLLVASCTSSTAKLPSLEKIVQKNIQLSNTLNYTQTSFLERLRRDKQVSIFEKGTASYQWSPTGSLNSYMLAYFDDKEEERGEWWFPGESYEKSEAKISQASVEPRNYSFKYIVQNLNKLASHLYVHEDESRPFLYILSFEANELSPMKENNEDGTYRPLDQKKLEDWGFSPKGLDIDSNFYEKTGDFSLATADEADRHQIREILSGVLGADFNTLNLTKNQFLNSLAQVRFYVAKSDLVLMGVDIRFLQTDKSKQDYLSYELSLIFDNDLNQETKIEAPKIKIEKKNNSSLKEPETEEENKNTSLELLKNSLNLAWETFNQANQYDTELEWQYVVKDGEQEAIGNLKTVGREYYQDNKFVYYLGKEVRPKNDHDFTVALALKEDESYEKPLSSLNKETMTEEELELEAKEEEKLRKEGKLTEKGWRVLDTKLGVKYYQNLLGLIKTEIDGAVEEIDPKQSSEPKESNNSNNSNEADKVEKMNDEHNKWQSATDEGELIFTYTIKGKDEKIFSWLNILLGSSFQAYQELEVEGTIKLIFNEETGIFSKVKINLKSLQNEVLDLSMERNFNNFVNDNIVPWPVDK